MSDATTKAPSGALLVRALVQAAKADRPPIGAKARARSRLAETSIAPVLPEPFRSALVAAAVVLAVASGALDQASPAEAHATHAACVEAPIGSCDTSSEARAPEESGSSSGSAARGYAGSSG